jgi:hypothetical protein
MKLGILISLTHFTMSLIVIAEAKPHDSVTDDQLAAMRLKASNKGSVHKPLPKDAPDPSKENQPQDLISQSDILCYNGLTTLVPKRAILNIPATSKDRLKHVDGSKIIGWAEFFQKNRGWITTVEVNQAQAEGNSALDEKVSEFVKKNGNLVVATFQGGPISVLPLKTVDKVITKKP